MVSSDAKTEVPSGLWAVLTRRGAGRLTGVLLSTLVEAMLNMCQMKALINALTYAKGMISVAMDYMVTSQSVVSYIDRSADAWLRLTSGG